MGRRDPVQVLDFVDHSPVLQKGMVPLFCKDPAASGLADSVRMNSDLYNFHTRLPRQHQYQPSTTSSSPSRSVPTSSIFCRSWNNGSCAWPYGQGRYRHHCEKREGGHPNVNCPFWPQRHLLSPDGPLPCKTSGVETVTRMPTSSVNNVNSVQLRPSFSPSHSSFPFPANVGESSAQVTPMSSQPEGVSLSSICLVARTL